MPAIRLGLSVDSAFRHWSASLALPDCTPTTPSADFRLPVGEPCGPPSPLGASGGSPGLFPAASARDRSDLRDAFGQLEDFGLCCTLVPRTAPHIRFSVRSARAFASGVAVPCGHCRTFARPVALRADLHAPLAGIRLPSATVATALRSVAAGCAAARLPSVGSALPAWGRTGPLKRANFLLRLMRFRKLGTLAKRSRQAAGHTRHTTRRRSEPPFACGSGR